MSDREKKLTALVALVLSLWLGNWGWQKYSTWRQAATGRRTSSDSAAQEARLELIQAKQVAARLRNYRERSLPSNPAVAQSQYRAWLVEQLQDTKLEVDDVSPRRSGQRTTAYEPLSYVVTASGKLESVVRFLDRFYRSDQLHKISALRMTPMSDDQRLRITLSVEALVVGGTERASGLASGTSDRLDQPSADEYVKRIVARNPFVAYEPPPPPRREPPKVVRQAPRAPAKPRFNHAAHAKLTAVVGSKDDLEAWISIQTLGEQLRLRRGDEIEVGQFKGTVLDVYQQELLVETEQGVVAIRLGKTLADGRTLTATSTSSAGS